MKLWPAIVVSGLVLFASCEKNSGSKIPQIALKYAGPDSVRANLDTAFIQFSFTDGDADLAGDTAKSAVFVKDKRYDSLGFVKYIFPDIDASIEDPKKGISGTAVVLLLQPPVTPRTDSLHMVLGDTTSFELYITDRAGNESNHITTGQIRIKP